MTTQLRRMDEIEGWRQKAFTLSRTDRLGRLITKTFDLIQTVVRDGPNAEILVHEVECLKTEQTNAIMAEPNLDDTHRSLLYGLSASLGIMIDSINERNQQIAVAQSPQDDDLVVLDVIGPKSRPWNHNSEPEITYLRTKSNSLSENSSVKPTNSKVAKYSALKSTESNSNQDRSVRGKGRVVVVPAESDQSRQSKDSSANLKSNRKRTFIDSDRTAVQTKNSEPPHKRPRIILTRNITDDASTATTTKAIATTPKSRNQDEESKKFSCNQCEKSFKTEGNLTYHKNIFHRGIQCGDCGVRLKSHDRLCKHYAEHHPGRSPFAKEDDDEDVWSLQCTHCDFRANYYSELKTHLVKHTGVYTCLRCPSSFTREMHLKDHVRDKHTKTIDCDICGNEFRSRYELYNHCQEEHSVGKRMNDA